ncbi:hypothetical protein WEI85_26145 [Actinomycetes bacterium KLBMP 9797]
MRVLFLGGPWHGERHEVVPSRQTRGTITLPTQYTVPGATLDPRADDRVVYIRRFAQGGGERLPVYVAPDYHGPARA